jgi:hypothetical protein
MTELDKTIRHLRACFRRGQIHPVMPRGEDRRVSNIESAPERRNGADRRCNHV